MNTVNTHLFDDCHKGMNGMDKWMNGMDEWMNGMDEWNGIE